MPYHPLSQDSGGSASDRRTEADRILNMLDQAGAFDGFTLREATFITEMNEGGEVSPKQLFWLRDIKDKYL